MRGACGSRVRAGGAARARRARPPADRPDGRRPQGSHGAAPGRAAYVNFESSHVHPIDLTPSGSRLLAVNTPDALLEVFTVSTSGGLAPERSIPVGLEPVTVVARTDGEAWVVNNLSDTVSIIDLDLGTVTRTLFVGDEPTDVVFASGRAFVAVSQEDHVQAYNLADLAQPPVRVDPFGRDVRALAASPDGSKLYAVVLQSGNQTTVINANNIWAQNNGLDLQRLQALGLNDIACPNTIHPPSPPKPAGLSAAAMEEFRQFALGMAFPPNPCRNTDDTVPNAVVTIPGLPNPGNPFVCQQRYLGTAGGKLGGLEPGRSAGRPEERLRRDPRWSDSRPEHLPFGGGFQPDTRRRQEHLRVRRDVPDRHPPGGGEEPDRAARSTAHRSAAAGEPARDAGGAGEPCRPEPPLRADRRGAVDGRRGARAHLVPQRRRARRSVDDDLAGEAQVTAGTLRSTAGGPITFTCATVGSGVRLGADRGEDGTFNGGDCAPGDAAQWQRPGEVTNVQVTSPSHLAWDAQVSADPTPVACEVAGALLSTLPGNGVGRAACLSGALASAQWDDARSDPPVGDGYYYLVRATKPCGNGGFGAGRAAMEALTCSP